MTLYDLFEQSKMGAAFSGTAVFDEPMSAHTTFKIGGPADLYIRPDAGCFMPYTTGLLRLAHKENIPVFILGGGANVLVSDSGIRGIVLDTGSWSGVLPSAETQEPRPTTGTDGTSAEVRFRSGTLTDEAVRWAAAAGLAGLEDFAGLPGTIGGAVWMNARCYQSSLSDLLVSVTFLDEHLEMITLPKEDAAYAYKKSPFQGRRTLIIEAALALRPDNTALITEKTAARRTEREEKGHFRYPSAGSVFKNNRDFGKPTGKIIEELGLRGLQSGGAQIAPWHGNFIINSGGATASDVQKLITLIQEKALQTCGFTLEPEVIAIGER
jgi:UDP-N-acetylmuramate dehydrogenase